jgi:ubiquitin carboxyl-terminal hydrolase 4/11/15
MGGAADLPQRSSSPLKRRADSMEKGEKEMAQSNITVVDSTAEGPKKSEDSSGAREESVDMLLEEQQSTTDEVTAENVRGSVPTADAPDIDEQIRIIGELTQTTLPPIPQEGDKVYLISKQWLQRVLDRKSGAKHSKDEESESEVGPVDNSDITQEVLKDADGHDFVRLKPGMGEDDFQILPQAAWDLIVSWHGSKSSPIIRTAHNTNDEGSNISYEYYPLVLRVHRLWSRISPIPIDSELKRKDPPPAVLVASRSDAYDDLLRRLKKAVQIEITTRIRISKLLEVLPSGPTAESPESIEASPVSGQSPEDPWSKLLVEVPIFTKLRRDTERELIDAPDSTVNPNYNGKRKVSMVLGSDDTLVLEEEIREGSRGTFLSSYTSSTKKSLALASRTESVANTDSGRSSPALSGPVTRGRSRKSGKTLGCVGLSNLGNTCYMNSALQCVRSVEELSKYFLMGEWKEELNEDNPLGNDGEVARAYASLLAEMYQDPPPGSVRPTRFKSTIGRYAPSFSGYGQQDSQEFLGFLLDGLQEDLSRIKKKPYIEKPDSTDEMVNDPEAIKEMAAKVWDITKKRDDSVIADLFTGMYKSTLVCPVCAKVSITFDPFNNLTLQLPLENTWSHTVFFVPLNDAPFRIVVDMDKHGSIKTLKDFVSKRVGVPTERLFAVEQWKSKIYKLYDDFKTVSEEIGDNDEVIIHELEAKPTNWPGPKKIKKPKSMLSFNHSDSEEEPLQWDSPLAEKMLVPVLHRYLAPASTYSNKRRWNAVEVPHFIVVTPEEVRQLNMCNVSY